jgi:hypothetical protein
MERETKTKRDNDREKAEENTDRERGKERQSDQTESG